MAFALLAARREKGRARRSRHVEYALGGTSSEAMLHVVLLARVVAREKVGRTWAKRVRHRLPIGSLQKDVLIKKCHRPASQRPAQLPHVVTEAWPGACLHEPQLAADPLKPGQVTKEAAHGLSFAHKHVHLGHRRVNYVASKHLY